MATDYEVTHAKSIQTKKDKKKADQRRKLATKIFEALRDRGAGIGNASIHIIEKVLEEN